MLLQEHEFTVFRNYGARFYTFGKQYLFLFNFSLITNELYYFTAFQTKLLVNARWKILGIVAHKNHCCPFCTAILPDQFQGKVRLCLVKALTGFIQDEQRRGLDHSPAQQNQTLDTRRKTGQQPVFVFFTAQKHKPFSDQLNLFRIELPE